MPKTTLIDTDYATLWYDTEKKIVHHKFHKYIYGPEFRNVLEKGLEVFKEKGACKWLSDDRNNSALPTEDRDWAQGNWSPRVIAAGWKYWAIVLPQKVIGQMNMQYFIDENTKMGLTVQVFSAPDEALQWLESQ
jgi:hypothetical protein